MNRTVGVWWDLLPWMFSGELQGAKVKKIAVIYSHGPASSVKHAVMEMSAVEIIPVVIMKFLVLRDCIKNEWVWSFCFMRKTAKCLYLSALLQSHLLICRCVWPTFGYEWMQIHFTKWVLRNELHSATRCAFLLWSYFSFSVIYFKENGWKTDKWASSILL